MEGRCGRHDPWEGGRELGARRLSSFPPDTPKAAEDARELQASGSAAFEWASSQLLLPTLPLGLTMTVLAAAYDPETGAAAMSADSLMGSGDLSCQPNPKILRLGDALVGLAGSPFYQRAIRTYRPYRLGQDAREWCEGLIDAVVALGKAHGHGSTQNSLHSHNIDLLVVLRGDGIWSLSGESDATPIRSPHYWAAGAGREVAAGAMYAMKSIGMAPLASSFSAGLVKRAAEAACALVPSCGGPVQIEELPPLPPVVVGELALEEAPGEVAEQSHGNGPPPAGIQKIEALIQRAEEMLQRAGVQATPAA